MFGDVHNSRGLGILGSLCHSRGLRLCHLKRQQKRSLRVWFLHIRSTQLGGGLVTFFVKRIRGFIFGTQTVTQPRTIGFSTMGQQVLCIVRSGLFYFIVYVHCVTDHLICKQDVNIGQGQDYYFITVLLFGRQGVRTTSVCAQQDTHFGPSRQGFRVVGYL